MVFLSTGIWSEIPNVINKMVSGEIVFLDGLPSELASFLASVVTALGGKRIKGGEEDEGGFYFPQDRWGYVRNYCIMILAESEFSSSCVEKNSDSALILSIIIFFSFSFEGILCHSDVHPSPCDIHNAPYIIIWSPPNEYNVLLILHYISLSHHRRETVTEKASKVLLDVCKDEILKQKAAVIPEGKVL